MPTNRRIFSQDAAATGDASSAQGLVLHLDANDEDSIESGGANTGTGSGSWFDIANHDLNVPLVDKASNLQLHLNASDTTSYSGSGSTWTDISGNTSNNGTIDGATFASDTRGYFTFDGSNDDIEIAASSNLVLGTVKTFEFWINAHTIGGLIFVRSNAGYSDYAYNFGTVSSSGDKLGVAVYNSGGSTIVLDRTVPITLNTFHHIVLTFADRTSGSAYKIYKDGTLASSGTLSDDADNDTSFLNYIGSQGGASDFLDGDISAIRCYDVALTASEVAQNFRQGNFLSYSSIYSTNLAMHLDAGDVTTVSASTWSDKANSNNGTLTGFSSTLSDFYDKELGNWLEFDGTDDKVTNSDCNLDSANISITAWVFLDHYGTGDGTSIVHLGSGSTAGTSILFRERSNGKLSVYDFGAANLDTDNVELSLSTWHYVALTVSGTTYKLYVDGVEKKSGTETAYSGDDRLIIGNYNNVSSGASSQFWDGKMGVVKLYNVALTPAQVAQNYLATKNDYPNGHNGDIQGPTFQGGSTPYYFDFDGSDDFVQITTNTSLDIGGAGYTFLAWARCEASSGTDTIISNIGSDLDGYQLAVNGTNVKLFIYAGSDPPLATITASSSVTVDTYEHYAFTVASDLSGAAVKLYINGSLVSSTTLSGAYPSSSTNLHLGKYPYAASGRYFEGRIGLAKVFQKELSASELLAEYNATKATFE